MKKLLIKNGQVIDPANGIEQKMDILIEEGKIKELAVEIEDSEAEVIDASSKVVTPGLIDMHVHLREPGFEHKETIKTGSESAIAGGFTSLACMPNTDPVVDNATVVESILTRAAQAQANIFPIGSITKDLAGKELAEFGFMKKAGIVAISDDGQTVSNSQLMRSALEYVKAFDLPVITHCEDQSLVEGGMVNEGYYSTVSGLAPIPAIAEDIIVARDIKLAELTNTPLHIAHVSTKGAVEIIREAKARGVQVTAEVTPHHLALTDELVTSFDTSTKVNPPLRSAEDLAALKEALVEGTIDVIATDHAPHAEEEKDVGYDLAPFGISGLETALSVLITELVKPGLMSFSQLIEKLTINPAQILGLDKGTLTVGADADLTIIDPELEYQVQVEDFYSKGKNSPFAGYTLTGKARATIVAGEVVMRDGSIVDHCG